VADTFDASPLRLIIVGLGFWGESWIAVVRQSRHCKLVALVDNDEAALVRCASAAGTDSRACFESIAAAAEEVESDAVLVVVPPAMHTQLALEALDHGLHCLIEKPFASTLKDARLVLERANSSELVVMVSQQYRFRPGARTVARLVETGAVGRIGAVHIHFANELPVRGFQHEMDEPLLMDMAIHHLDLMRGVLGVEPTRVQGASSNPSWSTFKGNTAATLIFDSEDGAIVTYTGTLVPRGARTGWDGVWDIFGEDGSIHWDGDEVLLRPLAWPFLARARRRALKHEWTGYHVKPIKLQDADRLGSLAEFRAAIRERREPETSGRDNIRSLALTIAAVESTRTRATVELAVE